MTHILIKQITDIIKNPLPNIKIVVDENNMSQIEVSMYYKKENNNPLPLFFPNNVNDNITINGAVDLNDFPNSAPTFILYGDFAHSHVYMKDINLFKICFSLDKSFEWFFSSKKIASSKFNPSVSLRYYLISVYKFLAEDDREHPITQDNMLECLKYWKKKNGDNEGYEYNECLKLFEQTDKQDVKQEIEKKYNIKYVSLMDKLIDYVDKDNLLLSDDNIVFPINYIKKSDRHIFATVNLDLMKYNTFKSGVRKTSLTQDFSHVFPIVFNSKIADKKNVMKLLEDISNEVFSKTRTNQIIKTLDKPTTIDFIIYIIAELFNELAIDVFKEDMFPCEEVLKAFTYLHHMLLYIDSKNDVRSKFNKILDKFNESNNQNKKVCPNVGVLMTTYLLTNNKYNYELLIKEMFGRNVLWSLINVKDCVNSGRTKKVDKNGNICKDKIIVDYDVNDNKFKIIDLDAWIDLTWKNSHVGMQRFAFQQLYNNKYNNETLETLDSKYGMPLDEDINIFQSEVKKICNWNKLDGRNGYKEFLEYFSLKEDKLDEYMIASFELSTLNGYHDHIIKKEWKSYINKKMNN